MIPFTAQALQDAQARKIPDVLENDPSMQAVFPSSGAHYAFNLGGKALPVRADVTKVLNKSYWASACNGPLLGAPRTVLLSATTDF